MVQNLTPEPEPRQWDKRYSMVIRGPYSSSKTQPLQNTENLGMLVQHYENKTAHKQQRGPKKDDPSMAHCRAVMSHGLSLAAVAACAPLYFRNAAPSTVSPIEGAPSISTMRRLRQCTRNFPIRSEIVNNRCAVVTPKMRPHVTLARQKTQTSHSITDVTEVDSLIGTYRGHSGPPLFQNVHHPNRDKANNVYGSAQRSLYHWLRNQRSG